MDYVGKSEHPLFLNYAQFLKHKEAKRKLFNWFPIQLIAMYKCIQLYNIYPDKRDMIFEKYPIKDADGTTLGFNKKGRTDLQ